MHYLHYLQQRLVQPPPCGSLQEGPCLLCAAPLLAPAVRDSLVLNRYSAPPLAAPPAAGPALVMPSRDSRSNGGAPAAPPASAAPGLPPRGLSSCRSCEAELEAGGWLGSAPEAAAGAKPLAVREAVRDTELMKSSISDAARSSCEGQRTTLCGA
jgi:hypothetical protein